jgi:hypothetical protein
MASPQDAEQAAQRAAITELTEALQAEYAASWQADTNKVAAKADAASEHVARYADWVGKIVAALAQAKAINLGESASGKSRTNLRRAGPHRRLLRQSDGAATGDKEERERSRKAKGAANPTELPWKLSSPLR